MFDPMPNSKKASRAGDTDRISALPDSMLQHVLSFLQVQEAVRSCVLARRWRYLWKSVPVLRLTRYRPVKESREFMDYLLVIRDRSPLDTCLFNFSESLAGDGHYVNLWIRYALLCQVRVLSVAFRNGVNLFCMARLPVISQNLTNLELAKVILNDEPLDFSCCPSLEELKMTQCTILVEEIFSRSLKRLSIRECEFYCVKRSHISVPSLTSLELTGVSGLTPFLEDMPALVTATVRFSRACWDTCGILGLESCADSSCECCYREVCGDASCECCYGYDDCRQGCVFLKALSAATDLKLIAEPELIVLARDLRRCPTFSKLKTLSLNEWCVTDDHSALICILQHTPVLENLSLQLFEVPHYVEPLKATYNLLEQSFASENLKIIEVACEEVDERVHNIVKSLTIYGIPLEKINIRQTKESSGCFNFVCTSFRPGLMGYLHIGLCR
ncbi:unnamed protein product [Alopecurus aequalis]